MSQNNFFSDVNPLEIAKQNANNANKRKGSMADRLAATKAATASKPDGDSAKDKSDLPQDLLDDVLQGVADASEDAAADTTEASAENEDGGRYKREPIPTVATVPFQVPEEETLEESDSPTAEEQPAPAAENTPAFTLISEDASVMGDIATAGALQIDGIVECNSIEACGDLVINGQVKCKKIECGGFFTNCGKVSSDDIVAANIDLTKGSITIGNLDADEILISGAHMGDSYAGASFIANPTAIIAGNITSVAITVNDGAAIDGSFHKVGEENIPEVFFKNLGFTKAGNSDDQRVFGEPEGEEEELSE